MAKRSHKGGAIALGLGIAAAAVGTYFLYGKDGKKNRKKVKGWMLKAKGEVLDQVDKLSHVSKADYMAAVDSVAKRYRKVKKVSNKELAEFSRDLKREWNHLQRQAGPTVKKVKSSAKKATRKVKKVAKKPSRRRRTSTAKRKRRR